MKEATLKYTNGEVTILWKPKLCKHSTICWRRTTGLPAVFNPANRPWVNPTGASTEKIIEQIKKCPSGALSFEMNNPEDQAKYEIELNPLNEVIIEKNGALIIKGPILIRDQNGNVFERKGSTSFCRCGASKNKPYCDDSHEEINFRDDD